MNPALPIIDDPELPKTVSYSALNDHHYCTWYYKLVNIERKKPWSNSPDTIFGSWIHSAVQAVAQGKSVDDEIKLFQRRWKTLCKIYKKFLTPEHVDYGLAADQLIRQMPEALKKEFGNFTVLHVELKLSLQAHSRWPQRFKGFIDIVLRLEDGKIIVADFKTSDSSFFFQKFQDKYKDYQLTLYKHFYCVANNVDPGLVETYFIVLEKNHKSKKPISFLRVTSGEIKVQNALKWLEFALSAINRKVFIKNRSNCLKYGEGHPCFFYKTPHCP